MTDDDPPPPPKPPVMRATAAQLAEGAAKRRAYEEQRRCHTEAWHRRLAGLADEPEDGPGEGTDQAQGSQPGRRRARARGKVHDPRQGSFEV